MAGNRPCWSSASMCSTLCHRSRDCRRRSKHPSNHRSGIMGARQRIGAVMASAGWSAVTLVWVGGTILHFFTAIVAFDLAGAGLRRYVAAIAAFIFPLAGEVAVMVAAWKASGSMINSYSIWVL